MPNTQHVPVADLDGQPFTPALAANYARLRAILGELGSVLVAYSGGVDSALLLKVAHDVLGEQCRGALAISPAYRVSI